MNYIYNFSPRTILSEHSAKFNEKKFIHNNICILALSSFLVLEQLYYGIFITESGSMLQKIYFISSFVMVFYSVLSGYFYIKKVSKITWYHNFFEISFGFFGFAISIVRALIVQNTIFALPTIYIAVLYGFAVFFYFPPIISFFIYLFNSILMILLLPRFQPDIVHFTYIQDIVSNNIIAFFAAIINYRRYVKEYKAQKLIASKNVELQVKTNKVEKTNEVLRYISNVDALTNIYNRRKLNEILEKEYDACKIFNRKLSLILMDVDLFKAINDTFGHTAGDKVLSNLGELLKNNVRRSEIVGRWGGEEFLIICIDTDSRTAYYLAERIRNEIEKYDFKLDCNLTCSFGVATNREIENLESLINRTDNALYKAKECGRNRVERG